MSSLLHAPGSVIHRPERLLRNFLWNTTEDMKKFHFVNRRVVTSPKEWGRVGVKNLNVFNRVLPGKWIWRYEMEGWLLKNVV